MSKNEFGSMFGIILAFIIMSIIPIGHLPMGKNVTISIGNEWENYMFTGFNYHGGGSYINPMTYTMTFSKDGLSYSFSFQTAPVHISIGDFNFTIVGYDRKMKTLDLAYGHKEIKHITMIDLLAIMIKRSAYRSD